MRVWGLAKLSKHFFLKNYKYIIILLILIIIYSKIAHLPYAIAIAPTNYQQIHKGDTMLLEKTKNNDNTTKLYCYDTFNSACTVAQELPDYYSVYYVKAVLPYPITILLIFIFIVINYILLKEKIFYLIIISLILNGILISMLYVDQQKTKLFSYNVEIEQKIKIKENNSIIYILNKNIENIMSLSTCRPEGVDVKVYNNKIEINLNKNLIEKIWNKTEIPQVGLPNSVYLNIQYSCELSTEYGVLYIKDSYDLIVKQLEIISNDSIIKIYNNNSIKFKIKIIYIYENSTTVVSEAVLKPFESYIININNINDIEKIYVNYEFANRKINMLVYG